MRLVGAGQSIVSIYQFRPVSGKVNDANLLPENCRKHTINSSVLQNIPGQSFRPIFASGRSFIEQ